MAASRRRNCRFDPNIVFMIAPKLLLARGRAAAGTYSVPWANCSSVVSGTSPTAVNQKSAMRVP